MDMRERKYIKFRVEMYSDTKFKIIDKRQDRDLIHYAWNRVVILAGNVNLEGELYLSKTIPYTIETLAIEFNREVDQIKTAFDVLIELEMIELTEDKVYKVKNFAKHQNTKGKEKKKELNKDENIKDKEIEIKENVQECEDKQLIVNEIGNVKDYEMENRKSDDKDTFMVINKDIGNNHNMNDKKEDNTLQESVPIVLESKRKHKKIRKMIFRLTFVKL